MPRRKQQAPKRASDYDSENAKDSAGKTKDTRSDSSLSMEKQLGGNDTGEVVEGHETKKTLLEEKELKSPVHKNDSPSVEPSGYEVDSESSYPTSDDEISTIKDKDDTSTDFVKDRSHGSVCSPDSLEQIKAIYKSFLNNPYWSLLSLNSSRPDVDDQPTSSSGNSSSNSSPGRNCYDWHQAAITKTLTQVSQKPSVPIEPSIFSTVQLYRQSTKLYGSIFTGASKFHCKSCSASYDTLLDLTVHMNETDHYRDDNLETGSKGSKSWSKPRKRSLLEMEGKEDAQKVLRCMYCGNSFESLQDLSVHMIKTKHYQKVPLREPRTAIAAKAVSSFRKKVPVEMDFPKLIYSTELTRNLHTGQDSDILKVYSENMNKDDSSQKKTTSDVHFKTQNFKCMQCGVSHDSLQKLSIHRMLTGHFAKVNQRLQKKEKPLHLNLSKSEESPCSSPLSTTTVRESLSFTSAKTNTKDNSQEVISQIASESRTEIDDERKHLPYLTEDDLKESPSMDFDILKSLENTVTSAISKAQRGAPSWGGYQSIHAAYQLQNHMKPALNNSSLPSSFKQSGCSLDTQSFDKSNLISPRTSPGVSSATLYPSEAKIENREKVSREGHIKGLNLQRTPAKSPKLESMVTGGKTNQNKMLKQKQDPTSISDVYNDSGVLSPQPEPKQPSVSPLSALQSVMNLHLGKAAKPVKAVQDPMSMLLRMSNSMAERAALPGPSGHSVKVSQYHDINDNSRDQPIDLSKSKHNQFLRAAALPGKALSSSLSTSSVSNSTSPKIVSPVSPLRENALSDISDMLRNLSDSEASNPSVRACKPEQSEIEGSRTSEDAEDLAVVHKRKGRHSHWKPQHLLILQARFTSCLRQTADGKYMISDLNSQERMIISHITGLSLTTISHWLANVKYQLRRTGRTKFIKNVDMGHPVFYCSECAMQYQARSAYICHLESHLGFKMKDLAKISPKDLNRKIRHDKSTHLKTVFLAGLPARGSQEKLLTL